MLHLFTTAQVPPDFSHLQESLGPNQGGGPDQPLINRLQEVIESHLDDFDLCSGKLHRYVPTSRATLHRLLHRHEGVSTSRYLSRYRIQRSLHWLADCQRSIADVAAKVGMNSSAYTRAFRAEFGHTPSELRHNWRLLHSGCLAE